MSIKALPATEVKNRFGRVLREVSQTGGPIVVERDGKPVAIILSMSEYERMQRQMPAAAALPVAAFGLWAARNDIDDEWLANGRNQWESAWSDE